MVNKTGVKCKIFVFSNENHVWVSCKAGAGLGQRVLYKPPTSAHTKTDRHGQSKAASGAEKEKEKRGEESGTDCKQAGCQLSDFTYRSFLNSR